MIRKRIGLVIGPILFCVVFFLHPFEDLNAEANAVLASTLWIATWWLSEALPISATALLPIALLPLSGGAPIAQTTAAYGDKMLFLFVGGFIIAIAMQRWNLHRRIAIEIISAVGTNAQLIVLGFMLATGLLSMWISNTATTLMMVTIATALIAEMKELTGKAGNIFFKSLLLGIAFSASIGGVATLVGTPTNPIFVSIASKLYAQEFSFASWMAFALPFSLVMLAICWIILTRIVFPLHKINISIGQELIQKEKEALGQMKQEEKVVAIVFVITAILWITRSFVLNQFIPGINDTVIAIAAALMMFILPSKSLNGKPLLTWEEAEKLPWGVIILFGGGLSLAAAFQSSQLAEWLGLQLIGISELPLFIIILIVALSVNFLTEVTSNVATASIMLPVLASLAEAIGVHPFLLMIPATMAASCAFMLPIATGPNAIVFSSGELKMNDMVRAGVWLNIISSIAITLLVYYIIPSFLK
ncbi:solute carrier family 13 (sodium-dependent dicarboxylate transporter), member 2/3/5 [Ekhidna lutea]|uniref:Solute carrier family 13 (Sodium-dependent dicarboxylate transporter), member 2/3/5 n=1 Tax=Ekhidna lutea TaxID=447679 RepID=A0A239FN12_EKHLU|nr:DASS family sodium-coupled anion symporter [Ekhidna lutea]SNS58265.1 solute carrier family 13 (sodium-dependent dicarboxylate transporter), member 2/3/5 [Ekhidna lutea]